MPARRSAKKKAQLTVTPSRSSSLSISCLHAVHLARPDFAYSTAQARAPGNGQRGEHMSSERSAGAGVCKWAGGPAGRRAGGRAGALAGTSQQSAACSLDLGRWTPW